MGSKYNAYRLYEYDVWGNAKDGYTVNDVRPTTEYYIIDSTLSDQGLIKSLKRQGMIRKGIHANSIQIDGDDEVIYFSYKGCPEFELRKEKGE